MSLQKSTPLNILIVDDEINIRKTLSICLETEGHSVITVSNFGKTPYLKHHEGHLISLLSISVWHRQWA